MGETKQPGETEPIPRREWVKGIVFVAVVIVFVAAFVLWMIWWTSGLFR
jgi:hypothetical protein